MPCPPPTPRRGHCQTVWCPPAGTTIKDGAEGGSQPQLPLTGHIVGTQYSCPSVSTRVGFQDPPQIPKSMDAQVP